MFCTLDLHGHTWDPIRLVKGNQFSFMFYRIHFTLTWHQHTPQTWCHVLNSDCVLWSHLIWTERCPTFHAAFGWKRVSATAQEGDLAAFMKPCCSAPVITKLPVWQKYLVCKVVHFEISILLSDGKWTCHFTNGNRCPAVSCTCAKVR